MGSERAPLERRCVQGARVRNLCTHGEGQRRGDVDEDGLCEERLTHRHADEDCDGAGGSTVRVAGRGTRIVAHRFVGCGEALALPLPRAPKPPIAYARVGAPEEEYPSKLRRGKKEARERQHTKLRRGRDRRAGGWQTRWGRAPRR